MTTKKKQVDDEAGEAPEVVDEAPVDETTGDGEATGVEPEPESPVVENTVERNDVLGVAQGILGVAQTGVRNHATKQALRRFQREQGLSPTGRLDALTQARLHL